MIKIVSINNRTVTMTIDDVTYEVPVGMLNPKLKQVLVDDSSSTEVPKDPTAGSARLNPYDPKLQNHPANLSNRIYVTFHGSAAPVGLPEDLAVMFRFTSGPEATNSWKMPKVKQAVETISNTTEQYEWRLIADGTTN